QLPTLIPCVTHRPWQFSPFLILSPSPPMSTLFPYTTLFRSQGEPKVFPQELLSLSGSRLCGGLCKSMLQIWPDTPVLRCIYDYIDRKSTRLNSSHSQISYAVFCLEKKLC